MKFLEGLKLSEWDRLEESSELIRHHIIRPVAAYQGPQGLESVLNFPMYRALVDTFGIPGTLNSTGLANTIEESKRRFTDTTLLGNFVENHDLPRWRNHSVDIQSLQSVLVFSYFSRMTDGVISNAMAFNFMSSGIPIVYYGQEQGFTGHADPVLCAILFAHQPDVRFCSITVNLCGRQNTKRRALIR